MLLFFLLSPAPVPLPLPALDVIALILVPEEGGTGGMIGHGSDGITAIDDDDNACSGSGSAGGGIGGGAPPVTPTERTGCC